MDSVREDGIIGCMPRAPHRIPRVPCPPRTGNALTPSASSPRTSSFPSRRRFLTATTATFAGMMVLPGHVLGRDGSLPPSERLNIAGVGVGGMGAHDLRELSGHNIVALCDVDARHAAHTFKEHPNARIYTDYRVLLEHEKEIDAVMVATPDHLHACVSMAAIQLGKHVYCEKPLTHSVWEAHRLAEAAREYKVATQMGNQGQASEETRRLCEMIWDDAIGPVREVHVWTDRPSNGLFDVYWPQGVDQPGETPPVPSTLDWDLWLGPAPTRPYHPAYLPFKWRGWWDFGTGALGDIGCHALDPVFRALKLGQPITVQASSTRVNKETYPVASMVTYRFPARGSLPPVTLVWYDGGLRPPRPPELDEDSEMGANGHLFIGDQGKILGLRRPNRRGYCLIPESRALEYGDPPRKLERSAGHHQEWIDACKGGKPAGSNFDWAGPLTQAVLLGNIALRPELRQDLTMQALCWDGEQRRFTNSDTANQFLRREYRAGWTL